MAIHELSFRSINAIATLSFYAHRVDLNSAITPEQLPSELGKLATRLRRETRLPIVADTTEFCLLSPSQLTSDVSFEILSVLAVELTAPKYRRQLEQILNQCVGDFFRTRRLRVDVYKHEAFLETIQISEDIEAQRFIKWELQLDSKNYVFLSIDYSNEYHSRFPLAQHDLSNLSPEQPLVHIYDGKTCRYVGLAKFTVSEPQKELGNISLLEYHRRKGEVSEQVLSAIPLETTAISVKYGSVGNTFIGSHIPNLLKKTFTRDDVEARIFNAQVLSINDRFERAIKGIKYLNDSGGLKLPGIDITSNNSPCVPEKQINYITVSSDKIANKYENNLDFGGGNFCSYPAQGLARKKLLEKPAKEIKVLVLQRQSFNVIKWCDIFKNFVNSFKIDLEIIEYRSYPVGNTLEIQRKCRELGNFDMVLMFVPDKETFTSTPKSDPYPVLRGCLKSYSRSKKALKA